MRKHTWLLPVAAVLAGGVCILGVVRARDDTDKEEQAKIDAAKKAAPDVVKLADAAAAGNAAGLKQQADATFKKYPKDMLSIMWQMKPRGGKGGLGVGPTPGAYMNDSIELQLLELSGRKAKTAKDIKDHGADWQQMLQVVKGISSVAPSYANQYAKNPAGEKAWNGLADDMSKGADDLIAAIKADDEKAFKKAVDNLNHSCNDCHTKFRDN